ncbi:MAG: lamin tail domain-containing protein, partial [Verrucomicrobiales bacterium]
MPPYWFLPCLILFLFAARQAATAQEVRISEFMASNNEQLIDANDDYSDWIELWNPTGDAIDLEGYYLTDVEGEAKWVFPATTLAPGGYLLIRASGSDERVGDELHTNFKLSRAAGGYLALLGKDGVTVIDEFKGYERQRSDISYGYSNTDKLGFFKKPTPGSSNNASINGFVGDTQFSTARGFYDASFELEITTETEGASILYTLDGSAPKLGSVFVPAHGIAYDGPITIDTTTTVRALASKSSFKSTNIDTHTYIFVDDVAKQPKQPEGWPDTWGTDGEVPGRIVAADYEMDPRVVNNTIPDYSVRDALLDIPTVSMVMDLDDFIGDDGIYTNPGSRGANFEMPCSMELIYPDGEKGFQVNCGVEIHGNSSRRPWRMQKHSLRVSFKTQYGPSTLRFPFLKDSPIAEYNKIILRACFTDSWGLVSWGPTRYRPNDSQYIRGMWMKHSMRDMGHDTMDGNFMHVYVNGIYFGLFNPAEKMEAESLVTHLGGSTEDYDVIDDFTLPPIDGESVGWNAMHGLSRQDLDVEENYQAMQDACDLENFSDYMLLHFFGDAEDWPHHNGHAMRNRTTNEPFKFYVWDQEIVLDNFNMRRYDSSDANRPGGLFQQLRKSKEFRLLFADRVQKHLFNDGALSIKASQDRYMALANQIDKAIVAESARWGDTATSTPYGNPIDVPRIADNVDDFAYPLPNNGPDYYFTRENAWLIERDNVVNHYIPATHDLSNSFAFINELKDEDLFPDTQAPHFNQHGGEVPADFKLQVLPIGGFRGSDTLYFTTDGSDPRAFGGNPSSTAQAYNTTGDGVPLTESVIVRARLQSKSNPFILTGEWSPMVEATFRVGTFSPATALRVSEIMYNPASPSEAERAAGFTARRDFEYLELVNTGTGTVILEGLEFSKGIGFHFPTGTTAELAPGAHALIVQNPEAMTLRYGDGLPIIGTFENGSQLANNGERLTLTSSRGGDLFQFAYSDREGWPQEADGDGHALVNSVTSTDADLGAPDAWVKSAQVGGSPGKAEGAGPPVIEEGYAAWRETAFPAGTPDSIAGPLSDPDQDHLPNLL